MGPERELEVNRLKMMAEGLGWDITATRSEGNMLKVEMEKTVSAEILTKEAARKGPLTMPA